MSAGPFEGLADEVLFEVFEHDSARGQVEVARLGAALAEFLGQVGDGDCGGVAENE